MQLKLCVQCCVRPPLTPFPPPLWPMHRLFRSPRSPRGQVGGRWIGFGNFRPHSADCCLRPCAELERLPRARRRKRPAICFCSAMLRAILCHPLKGTVRRQGGGGLCVRVKHPSVRLRNARATRRHSARLNGLVRSILLPRNSRCAGRSAEFPFFRSPFPSSVGLSKSCGCRLCQVPRVDNNNWPCHI